MQRLFNLLTACLLLNAALPAAWSCPFCPPSFRNSILQELDATPVAVLAELVSGPRRNDDGSYVTGYRVAAVLRGGEHFRSGDLIEFPQNIPSPVGSVHLLLADPQTANDRQTAQRWQNPRGLSSEAQQFLREASRLPAVAGESVNDQDDQLQRLAFVLNHLNSNDPDIARAAYGEFAAAPYATVKELAPVLNPNQLRAWIEIESGVTNDRRLLFTLLAICGRPQDAAFVKAALDARVAAEKVAELDGVIAAYLTLAGTEGLEAIDRELLEPDNVSPAIRRAAHNALRFHAEQESILTKQRIIASCRLLLDDPRSADYAIRDLTRWQDWQSLDAVIALLDQHAEQCKWLKVPIREYLEACPLSSAQAALVSADPATSDSATTLE